LYYVELSDEAATPSTVVTEVLTRPTPQQPQQQTADIRARKLTSLLIVHGKNCRRISRITQVNLR